MPAITFSYEFSPILMKHYKKENSFSRLLVNVRYFEYIFIINWIKHSLDWNLMPPF